jgi:hypothetical protein
MIGVTQAPNDKKEVRAIGGLDAKMARDEHVAELSAVVCCTLVAVRIALKAFEII